MNPERFKTNFLRRIGSSQVFQQLLELLPDVAFFMKDRQGRFVMQNRRACEYCRVGSEAETLGKTDYDFWSPQRAAVYVAQDRKVMETGEPIINALTLAPEEVGPDHLVIYSKVPVRDNRQRIIGVAGIHREVEGLRTPPRKFGPLTKAVQRMHQDFAEPLTTPKLAAIAGLSRSQFERVFHRLFGTSPREYLLRVRVNAACRLLTGTDRKCTDIALATGFYDHSHFSRLFQRIMGIAPQHYRRRHAPMESGCSDRTGKKMAGKK
ncbi:MAG: helix-turn-helix domain-containing protein [Verrucomicrobiota bacterium]